MPPTSNEHDWINREFDRQNADIVRLWQAVGTMKDDLANHERKYMTALGNQTAELTAKQTGQTTELTGKINKALQQSAMSWFRLNFIKGLALICLTAFMGALFIKILDHVWK